MALVAAAVVAAAMASAVTADPHPATTKGSCRESDLDAVILDAAMDFPIVRKHASVYVHL